MKRLFLLLFGLLILAELGFAQDSGIPIIEIDSVTHAPKQQLPFDQEFYLKIWKNKDESVDLVKIQKYKRGVFGIFKIGNDTFKTYKWRERQRIQSTYLPLSHTYSVSTKPYRESVKDSVFVIEKKETHSIINKEKYALVKIFPLNPLNQYVISYSKGVAIGNVSQILLKKLNAKEVPTRQVDAHSDDPDSCKQELIYFLEKEISRPENWASKKAIENTISCMKGTGTGASLAKETAEKIVDDLILEDSIRKYLKKQDYSTALDFLISKETSVEIQYEKAKSDLNLNYLADIKRLWSTHDSLMHFYFVGVSAPRFKENNPIAPFKDQILKPAAYQANEIKAGMLPIKYSFSKNKAEKDDYTQRVKNLDSTITTAENILSRYYVVFSVGQNSSARDVDMAILDCLQENRDSLSKRLKQRENLLKSISNYEIRIPLNSYDTIKRKLFHNYKSSKTQNTATGGYSTVKTKAKFTVRPDIGFAMVSDVNFNGKNEALWSPQFFAGVRINFRPLDPELSFSKIKYKSIWHHLSFNVAATTSSISDGETRFDTFKNINPMVGFGVRFNNYLNFTSGVLMFQKKSDDVLLTNTEFAVMPYAGVSIDIDVADTFKNLFNAFSK